MRRRVECDDDVVYSIIGKRLRKARLAKGLNQATVAEKLGYTRATIANFEAGRQRLRVGVIYGYADLVDMEIGELFPSIYGIWWGEE